MSQTIIYLLLGGLSYLGMKANENVEGAGMLCSLLMHFFLFSGGCILPAMLIILFTGKWKTPILLHDDGSRQ